MNRLAEVTAGYLAALLLLAVVTSASKTATTTGDSSISPGTPIPFPDPELLRYLRQLYQGVKLLGRPLVNGELNLLPERAQGFANSVKCFSGEFS